MDFSAEEHAIIEKALKAATANTGDHHAVFQYQKVLQKLQGHNNSDTTAQQDGFRYDYDDSKDV
ncbi:hypothetical protein ACOJQI_10890 [Bacillus salacetis]|uniref:hypothetical protein n=1 Tax=Bacillus salacetis TaxID=2315464 RepID=UPI003BA04C1D